MSNIRTFLNNRVKKASTMKELREEDDIASSLEAIKQQPEKETPVQLRTEQYVDDDDIYEKTSVGIPSLIGATKKLLAISRGEVEPDDRDNLRFKRVYNIDDLLAERTRMDAGKLRNSIMYRLSKVRNLQSFPTNAFDPYVLGHIIGNSLSLPSEEINPLYLLDQQSRLTVFGQGGLGSVDAASKEAQNVNSSQFGYVCPIASPDGMKAGLDTRLASQTRISKRGGQLLTKVYDRKRKKYVWVTPDVISNSTVALPG